MKYVIQTVKPIIEFYQFNNRNGNSAGYKYKEFSPFSKEISGKGLQSYSFSRSVNNFSGSFQLSIKEESNNIVYQNQFTDYVKPLDIVKIIENENDKSYFWGIVTTKKISANANGQKILNISGRSIEYLFEFLTISLDVTAMAWAGQDVNVTNKNLELKLSENSGTEALSNKTLIKTIYDNFTDVAKTLNKISNVAIIDLIEKYIGTDFLENNSFINNEKFNYPISSNLYGNSTINIINYIKNLYPDNVYEFYGIIENGNPKIRLRKNPFSKNDWKNLRSTEIKGYSLINYDITQSNDEVYTVFYSYIEGSVLAADYYNKLTASGDGYATSVVSDKTKYYGYKPLQCNFIGFNSESAELLADKMSDIYKKLNNEISDWYSNLDEMYKANITIVNILDSNKPKIGEKIKFIGGEFYVTSESHNWQYGSAAKINYGCERGGEYNDGGFSELKNVSNSLVELKNAGN